MRLDGSSIRKESLMTFYMQHSKGRKVGHLWYLEQHLCVEEQLSNIFQAQSSNQEHVAMADKLINERRNAAPRLSAQALEVQFDELLRGFHGLRRPDLDRSLRWDDLHQRRDQDAIVKWLLGFMSGGGAISFLLAVVSAMAPIQRELLFREVCMSGSVSKVMRSFPVIDSV